MPVVIKELVITATVDVAPPDDREPAEPAPNEPGSPLPQLVQACVEQVLAVLREQAER